MAMFQTYRLLGGGTVRNRIGYEQPFPAGVEWSVADAKGDPLRVHDGFAQFDSEKTSAWCAELMNGAFEMGREAARAEMRAVLGIVEDNDA